MFNSYLVCIITSVILGDFIPYTMEDLEWYGYEDEVTGEWIGSLVVVYDPSTAIGGDMNRERWHRALHKINQVQTELLTFY